MKDIIAMFIGLFVTLFGIVFLSLFIILCVKFIMWVWRLF